jgi:hypothetical protein
MIRVLYLDILVFIVKEWNGNQIHDHAVHDKGGMKMKTIKITLMSMGLVLLLAVIGAFATNNKEMQTMSVNTMTNLCYQ